MNKRIKKKKRKEIDFFWNELGIAIRNFSEFKRFNREFQAADDYFKRNKIHIEIPEEIQFLFD